jgi:hypothetical protein
MNTFEQLASWYLRLNGYFVTPNFIAHGDGGPRTDVDVLAVRFPHSREFPDDDVKRLQIPPHKVDVVFAESKASRCKLNGPWKAGGDNHALEYVLRRVGIFAGDVAISSAADQLYKEQKYENGVYVVRIVCFGAQRNGTLPRVTQILWPDVLSFFNQRFREYQAQKAEHQHWDSFGNYLWERLSEDVVPDVVDIVDGWKAKCPCWSR